MIRLIGIIVQGPNDRGFLLGLRDRLGCEAEFYASKDTRGRNKFRRRRDARLDCTEFERRGVDLIVRRTDSGSEAWQQVKREELQHYPARVQSRLVCGVTPGDIENWLLLDRRYSQDRLGIPANEVIPPQDVVGRIKGAIAARKGSQDYEQFIRDYVRSADERAFSNWLRDDALRNLYQQCRDAALIHDDCRPLNDELRSEA